MLFIEYKIDNGFLRNTIYGMKISEFRFVLIIRLW